MLLFLGVWLVGWTFGETFAAYQLSTGGVGGGGAFLIVWLTLWTVGGCFAFYVWLWTLVGKEVVRLEPGALTLRRDVLGLGRTREYDLAHVSRLREAAPVADAHGWGRSRWPPGIAGGVVAFDYGSETVRFGASIDEAEGHQIVEELQARHTFERDMV